MSLVDQIAALATQIADQFNTTVAAIDATTGSLTSLTTANQTSLVAAINEVKADVSASETITSAAISDATTIGKAVLTAATDAAACTAIGAYTSAQTDSAISTATANLVSSAPGTLDTLNELASALGDDPNFAATTATALGNRLRVDTATQNLTAAQQTNGQTNLGVYSVAQIGDVTTNFAAAFTAALT
jgi:hypothetical protein